MSSPVGFFASNGRYEFPDELLASTAMSRGARGRVSDHLWRIWDYPYPEAQALIEGMRDQLGADRLVWGSDMPNVERFCTYRQSLDYVRQYCPFLTAREKDLSWATPARRSTGSAVSASAVGRRKSEPNGRRGCAQPSLPT